MINKIWSKIKVEKGQPQRIYEITVKDLKTKEILYQYKGFGGLFCTIEKIISFKGGIVEGHHQSAAWGHPLLMWYCLERLEEFVKGNMDKVINAMKDIGISISDIERMKKLLKEKK